MNGKRFMTATITRLQLACLVAATQAVHPAAAQQPANTVTDAPLTLQAVLDLARANSQAFRAAQLASGLAAEDRKQAKAALLPSLNGFSQYIYTQPNGTPSGIWVPNDGPRVYAMWLVCFSMELRRLMTGNRNEGSLAGHSRCFRKQSHFSRARMKATPRLWRPSQRSATAASADRGDCGPAW